MSMQAGWRGTIGPNRTRTPFWDEPEDIHLLQVPGMGQQLILPDSCHVFHLGWGLDLAASGICLLAKLQCFPGRKFDLRLQNAYISFTRWISDNKKTTGISWWSTRKLDMKEHFGFIKIKILESMIILSFWVLNGIKSWLVLGTRFTFPPARCHPVKTIGRPPWDLATARLMTRPWCSSGWRIYCKGMILGEVCWG